MWEGAPDGGLTADQDVRLDRVHIHCLGDGRYWFRPYVWTRLHCLPAFQHCYPVASMYKAYSRKPIFGFWPTLVELAVCRLRSGLEGR